MRREGISPGLRLGVATVDITPRHPVPLAGFASRRSAFVAVDRPLLLKAWAFESGEPAGGAPVRALFVQADLIWWGSERLPALLRELSSRWGLPASAVILHATHTHGGPQTSDRFAPSLGLPDEDYVRDLEARLLSCVDDAFARLEPVAVERGRGACAIGVHRRRRIDGRIAMAPNPEGPCDPEVVVVRFRRADGTTAGVWAHYACHPTTTDDNVVHPDFPGIAMTLTERWLGEGATASYLQGCCGDIRPALVQDGGFRKGERSDVLELGRRLADEVVRILEGPMERLEPAKLASGRLAVELPLEGVPGPGRLKEAAAADGIRGEWARLLSSRPDRLAPTIPLELNGVRIARGLTLLAMNAEMVGAYGAFAKSYAQGAALPLPYSNGMIGYVPTAEQLAEGGYEPAESAYYFALPSPFAPEVEARVVESMKALLDNVLEWEEME
ncbi:hypothetical protein FE782_22510 [Paenibacillus antri]|uniref:Neutral/alkaline non-lysosomal ceramidase N-terminal domain-containing protein n=1 Tax=Paenibacillus antri TaxID=2582848 RepID=A0A5R9G6W2_9BACL|nr:neutral/alkaline non-lysosomal ceramidase N-terminal domain-containing protein [Paenibacillus antri]TLS50106.1 hypothetical protein FE782_22510 [Paenibacillus antri]